MLTLTPPDVVADQFALPAKLLNRRTGNTLPRIPAPVVYSRVAGTAALIVPFDDDNADPTAIGISFIPARVIVPGLPVTRESFSAPGSVLPTIAAGSNDFRFVVDRAGPVAAPAGLLQSISFPRVQQNWSW